MLMITNINFINTFDITGKHKKAHHILRKADCVSFHCLFPSTFLLKGLLVVSLWSNFHFWIADHHCLNYTSLKDCGVCFYVVTFIRQSSFKRHLLLGMVYTLLVQHSGGWGRGIVVSLSAISATQVIIQDSKSYIARLYLKKKTRIYFLSIGMNI